MLNQILRAIEDELHKNNLHFFSYVWREEIQNELKADSRYQKLLNWINAEIGLRESIINVIGPADGDISGWDLYIRELGGLAALIHLREILTFRKCTDQMRGNIEKCVCEKMKIRYWENIDEYLPTDTTEGADNG